MQFLSLDRRLLSILSSERNMLNSDSALFSPSEIDMRKRRKPLGDVKVQSGFGSAKTTFKTTLKTAPKRGPFLL